MKVDSKLTYFIGHNELQDRETGSCDNQGVSWE